MMTDEELLIELGLETDEPIPCQPHSIECSSEACVWWVADCCLKRYPLCWIHDIEAVLEIARTGICTVCFTRRTDFNWVKIPIRRA